MHEMEMHRHMPSLERSSILIATILLAYALGRFIRLPARELSVQLPSLYLAVQINAQTFVALILIAVIGPDGRRQYNNPYYAAILEDPDILLGTDSFVDIHPEDRERIRSIFQEILRSGEGRVTEYRLMDRDGNTRFIDSRSSVTRDEDGKPKRVIVFSRDVKTKARARRQYDSLVAATAGVAGETFFPVLVQRLSEALDVPCVLISGALAGGGTHATSLAFWAQGTHQPPLEYSVAGTPCERVLREGATTVVASALRSRFAEIPRVGMPDAESYLGTPLPGPDGKPIGHLFVMDEKPLEEPQRKEFILRVFAHRAALELLRLTSASETGARPKDHRTEHAPSGDHALWLDQLGAAVIVRDSEGRITCWNGAAGRMYERSAEETIGKTLAEACGASEAEIYWESPAT